MAKSIKKFFEARYKDEIYAAVNEHLQSHLAELEARYSRLQHIGHLVLGSVDVMALYSDMLTNQKMEIEIAVQATVVCFVEKTRAGRVVHPWYYVKAAVAPDLKHGFLIESVMPYVKKPHMYYARQDGFVPEIRKENLEEKAEEILRKYYPEALEQPMPVNPAELVRRMGLSLVSRRISKDGSVFGRIFFEDKAALFFNEHTGTFETVAAKAGTVFVDPIVSAKRTPGSLGNTIIHECVHWHFHRDVFAHGASMGQIECGDKGTSRGGEWSVVDIAEWQANAVTPRVQMPVKNFRQKVAEYTASLMEERQTYSVLDVIEPVITRLSKFFNVSRLSAKIRMVELGYDVARGAFIYADNRCVKPHGWKPGFLKERQTFSVKLEDAFRLRTENPDFYNDPRSLEFVYVDSHFVYNRPRYVRRTPSGLELTEYALSHMDECCLVFELDLSVTAAPEPHGPMFYLNREEDNRIVYDIYLAGGLEAAGSKPQIQAEAEALNDAYETLSRLPGNYAEALRILVEESGMSIDDIAYEIGASTKTITRILSGESGSIENLSFLCLSLQLHPVLSDYIIRQSPWKFDYRKKEHRAIRECVHLFYGHKMSYIYKRIAQLTE